MLYHQEFLELGGPLENWNRFSSETLENYVYVELQSPHTPKMYGYIYWFIVVSNINSIGNHYVPVDADIPLHYWGVR